MKLTFATLLLPLLAFSADAGGDVFRLHRISYNDLMSGDESMKSSFVDALTTTGMISVTDIPDMNHKDVAMAALHECAIKSKATQVQKFPDGTQRLTIATHSLPGYIGTINHKISFKPCDSFNQAAASFRPTVMTVTQAFADRMTDFFDMVDDNEPLLSTATNFGFPTIANVVENGEHLEHFHSYQKLEQSSSQEEEETIELHTDQGLFLAFTPGRMHQEGTSKAELSSGFFIKDQIGAIVEVAFDEGDDLIFMLGDGVNQYLNNRLSKKLHAVPHALIMPPHDETETRVWYGRMILPPIDAVHPSHGITFGKLRERMIDSSLNNTEEMLGMGCSSGMVARELHGATACEGDSIYCWHRCMNASDYGTSAEECLNQDLQLLCINPRLQISDGESHGDFYPACADPAVQETETPYPTLPDYPRPEATCTDELYNTYADSTVYDHSYDLKGNATFMWSVENNDTVNGRLVFDGLFGWIAFGFANVGDGKLNGMLGATIIMALPGGNYSAFSGLDLSLDPTIEEYVIDPNQTAFRHWMSPVTSTSKRQDGETGLSSYKVDSTDCFTALSFKTSSIHNINFNLTGSDELLWAANGQDYYAGYHGDSRGRFAIHWPTGVLTAAAAEVPDLSSTSSAVIASSLTVLFLTVTMTFNFLG